MIQVTDSTATLAAEFLSDYDLLARLAVWRHAVELAQKNAHALEEEALRRMEVAGATSIPSEQYVCEVVQKNTYNQGDFTPLLEVLNEQDLAEVYTAQREEMVMMPAKWNTVKLLAKARRYGDKALAVVEAAKVLGKPTLKFGAREKP